MTDPKIDSKAVDKPADEPKLSRHQATVDVEHFGSHQPTDEQLSKALRGAAKDRGHTLAGEYGHKLLVNTSGGPSTVEFFYHTKD